MHRTIASLKKTCRKQGISFWHYLQDRVIGVGAIPPLPAWFSVFGYSITTCWLRFTQSAKKERTNWRWRFRIYRV